MEKKAYTWEEFKNETYGLKRAVEIKWENFVVGMKFCSFCLGYNKNYEYKKIPQEERRYGRTIRAVVYKTDRYMVLEREDGSPYVVGRRDFESGVLYSSYLMRDLYLVRDGEK